MLGPGHWPVACYVSSSSLIYVHTMHTSLRVHYVRSMGDDVEYVTGLGVHKIVCNGNNIGQTCNHVDLVS